MTYKSTGTKTVAINWTTGAKSKISTGNDAVAGRSGKTNGIVIEAKMRAGRRRKLLLQETGWREPNYAGVSVI
jgi:hypothetical protein